MHCVALILAALTGTAAPTAPLPEPAPGRTISVAEAQSLAVAANQDLASARASLQARDGTLLQARAWPNPDLGVEVENLGPSSPSIENVQTTWSLSQPLEISGRRGARVRAATADRAAAAAAVERRRLDLRLEVARAFATVLATQRHLEISEQGARTAAEVAEAVDTLVGAGEVSPIEASRTRTEVALARAEVEAARADLDGARRRLAMLWGDSDPGFDSAVGDLADTVSAGPLADLQTLPDIVERDNTVTAAEARAALARALARPDPALSVGYRSFAGSGDHAWVAGLALPLPLFDTGRGAQAAARAEASAAVAERAAAATRVTAAARTAELAVGSAREEARLLSEDGLPAARDAYAAVEEGYRRGKLPLLDLLDARRSRLAIERRHVDVLLRLSLAVAELERYSAQPAEPAAGGSR